MILEIKNYREETHIDVLLWRESKKLVKEM
jgi:hypothetical protein